MRLEEDVFFSQQKVLELLNEAGFKVTKSTILRFVQNGYILQPKRRKVNVGDSRIYYNPLVVIEIMAATLLFKGDYLSSNSVKRISRFVDEDLFLGRLLFYSDIFDNEKLWQYKFAAYSFGGFTTCIKEYKHLSVSGNEELPMHEYDINEFLERFIPEIVDAYDIEDLEFTKCYIGYMSYIYGQTFTKLYEKYYKLIRIDA